MKKIALITIFLITSLSFAAADGNETVDLLKSPDILASGGSYTSMVSPMADIMNPAASALQQRMSLNLNFMSMFGDEDEPGYSGTAFNLGAAFPLRAGVITASGGFLGTSALSELNAGSQGGLSLGFAKELYPGLLTGAGINSRFGESWALTADIGFIKEEGTVGFMKDMNWGVVLGELGYSGFSDAVDVPSLFTPSGGISFNLLDTDNIVFGMNGDLSFPFFRNIRLNIGGNLELFNFAGLQFSSTADLRELAGLDSGTSDVSALIPAFGIYFTFKTDFQDEDISERGWSSNDIRTSVSASPMANGLWAAGAGLNVELGVIDETPPAIEFDLSDFLDNEGGLDNDSGEREEPEDKSDEVSVNSSGSRMYKSLNAKADLKSKILTSGDGVKSEKNGKNPGNIDEGPGGERIIKYLSPNNDGIKDTIEIPVKITDSRYIKGFSFIVENESGEEVKRIENKEKRPENVSIANFFQRLFYVEKGVDIPEVIRWDGIGDNGEVVSDGFYRFYMQAWDDNGNTTTTDKYGIVIDNTPPDINVSEIENELKIFSPNNDGNKDSLEIVQSGSSEDRWNAAIKSSDGRVYKNYVWEDSAPENIIWDGKDNKKLLAPDGVYFYYIEAEDRAGNSSEAEVANLIINTQTTPISMSVNASYFAPGMEGSRTEISFIPEVPVKTGIDSWSMKIVDQSGTTVKTYSGEEIPESFRFDGALSSGYISEGKYRGILEIEYINGNRPSAESPEIICDKSAPEASAKLTLRVFSPNGDGKKDEISIYQETTVEDVWYAEIADSSGDVIKKYKWLNNAEASFSWDGYTDDGKLAADGEYSYRLYTTDRAGNSGESIPVSFSLDTEETPVMLTARPEAFSPNGDGVKDDMIITPVLNVTEGIQSYKLVISDDAGNIIKTIKSSGRIKNEFVWDGIADSGRKALDGKYRAALEVIYEKGNISNAVTRDFTLDTVYPEIAIETEYTLFSPDNDGRKDNIVIKQSTSSEELITGTIKNRDGKVVREYFWEGNAEDLVWDGTDSNGNRVEDGLYEYSIETQDAGGNLTKQIISRIEIDNRQTAVFVTAGSNGFTPNNDGKEDKIEFATMATLKEGVEDWEFVIKKNGVSPVKSFRGDVLPEKIVWDGRDENGRVVEGDFNAEYTVRYKKGNEPVSVTKEFGIDITAPEVSVSSAPQPFSPDNDGVDDELEIKISVSDNNRIESWSLEIVDREGNPFTSFGGSGKPAESIIWDGLGKNGELVIAAEDYPYRLTVVDEYGNKAQEYGVIPVDVLVVKEGDKLKIRIANITFAPDSAELRKDDPEIKAKNEYVLGRLSEILGKYSSYRILIEGHAVSVYWADKARAEKEESEELLPLSKARAETVKNYLGQLGISANRMTTEGIGGRKPIVPHGDLDNRWKNRRVEFILLK